MSHKAKTVQLIMLLLLIISFQACKKDAISVKKEKSYHERIDNPTGGWITEGMGIRMQRNGSATLIEGGDMASEGSYRINGDRITLKIPGYKTLKFTIISEQEIHADSGETLYLSSNE